MADVFLSYARADRGKVDRLAEALQAGGRSVWWDRQIVGGSEFSGDIERELTAAKAVIVCWSAAGGKSRWVKDEASLAADHGKMIAVSLDGAEPPIGYRQFHCIDLSRWSGAGGAHFEDLARAVETRVGAAQLAPAPPPKKLSLRERLAMPLPLSVLVAIVAAVALGSLLIRGPAPDTEAPPKPDQAVAEAVVPGADIPSIAVLPFRDFSESSDQEYLADGVTEEILAALSRVQGLRVVSRTSAFHFKDSDAKIADIAKALNVRHVLEGSVRKSGTAIRITAQLIEARTDAHVWSNNFDRSLTANNLFEVQDGIAKAVVEGMRANLILPAAATAFRTSSTKAYEAYLRGKSLARQRRKQTVLAAIASLKEAVALDPDFVPAWFELAVAHELSVRYAGVTGAQASVLADPLFARVIEMAPKSLEALRARALLADDPNEALRAADLTVAAYPNDAEAHFNRGNILRSAFGRTDEALLAYENARQLDPLQTEVLNRIVLALLEKGEPEKALEIAKENLRWNPTARGANLWYGIVCHATAHYEEAHRYLRAEEALNPVDWVARNMLFNLYFNLRMHARAEHYADDARRKTMLALASAKREDAADLAAHSEDPSLAHLLGLHDLAYAGFRDHFSKSGFEALPPSWLLDSIGAVGEFERAGDKDAVKLRRLIDARFASPHLDLRVDEDLRRGAAWAAYNKNEQRALTLMDSAIAAGFAMRDYEFAPEFDAMRAAPAFQARLKKIESVAARHRAAVEAQLANPEPGWVSP